MRLGLLIPLLAVAFSVALADTVTYEYDALGRLTEVRHSDGSTVTYTLDPAGNRTQVATSTPPGTPASISVPAISSTGSYTISWGSSTGAVSAYELYEANNSGFSGQSLVYSGTATSQAISGKGNGSYYYRVRACNGSPCSAYRTGGNAVTVTLAAPSVPAAPASISGPSQSTSGNYSISWSASAGATRYELWESIFGSAYAKVYDGPGTSKSFSSKPNGEYEYQAKACSANGCSGFSPRKLVLVCKGGCSFFAPPPPK